MTETYKEHVIKLDENNPAKPFAVYDGNNMFLSASDSLKGARKIIDRLKGINFKRTPAYLTGYQYSFEKGEITSMKPDGNVVFVYQNKRYGRTRSSESLRDLIKITPENEAIIDEIKAIQKQQANLTKDIEAKVKLLDRYKREDLVNDN